MSSKTQRDDVTDGYLSMIQSLLRFLFRSPWRYHPILNRHRRPNLTKPRNPGTCESTVIPHFLLVARLGGRIFYGLPDLLAWQSAAG